MAKVCQRSNEGWNELFARVAAAIRSDNPEEVSAGLQEADDLFFYDPAVIGSAPLPLLLALEYLLDRSSVVGVELVQQGRALLMEALYRNHRLIDLDHDDISRLVKWYHQQEDSEPFAAGGSP